jgi:hypothetical protein
MPEMNLDRLVWLDLETTGLDPMLGHILEVGLIVTDRNLDRVFSFSQVFRPELDIYSDDYQMRALEMHHASGLLAACNADGMRGNYDLDAIIHDEIVESGGVGSPLCGASVHFDRDVACAGTRRASSAPTPLPELRRLDAEDPRRAPRRRAAAEARGAPRDPGPRGRHRAREARIAMDHRSRGAAVIGDLGWPDRGHRVDYPTRTHRWTHPLALSNVARRSRPLDPVLEGEAAAAAIREYKARRRRAGLRP